MLTQHRHKYMWIQGRATNRLIEVCYGVHGVASDFHVVRWPEDTVRRPEMK